MERCCHIRHIRNMVKGGDIAGRRRLVQGTNYIKEAVHKLLAHEKKKKGCSSEVESGVGRVQSLLPLSADPPRADSGLSLPASCSRRSRQLEADGAASGKAGTPGAAAARSLSPALCPAAARRRVPGG